MNKIPTLFLRDPATGLRTVTRQLHPACGWVAAGEGAATRKFDGTCVMLDDQGRWWARREVNPGKKPPPNFTSLELDEETGRIVGWEPITQSAFARWHAEARTPDGPTADHRPSDAYGDPFKPGTYELCGPKINGDPEGFAMHVLVPHGGHVIADPPQRTYDALAAWLANVGIEGIVWHHPDGRMAKLKRRDFGFPRALRPQPESEHRP